MKYFVGAALLAAVAGFGMLAQAEDKKEEITITGEVVDLACWLEEGKMGPEHAKCAQSCVKGGTPAGIVTEGGQVYLVVVHGKDGKAPLDKVGKRIEAKGHAVERGGMNGFIATSCKELEAPKPPEGSGK